MAGTYTKLTYHLVFSTKRREPIILESFREGLYAYIGGIIRGEGGQMMEIGGMSDHVHILMRAKPTQGLSEMMQKIKGNSSTWVNLNRLAGGHFEWQEGYGAFTVSESQIDTTSAYIRAQTTHHATLSFQDEFTRFLERHGIEFNSEYIWR